MIKLLQKQLHGTCSIYKMIHEDVLMIENFISEREIDEIFDIIKSSQEQDWMIEYQENLKRFCMEKFNRDDVDNLIAEGKFEVTQNWNDKNLNISNTKIQKNIYERLQSLIKPLGDDLELSGFATIQRMQSGVELKSHTDQDTDPSIKYATILYLNEEYGDGELFFPSLDLEVKPKAGSLLIFPGTKEYEHGVRHVADGPTRYVLVGFVKIKDFYKNSHS